MDFVGYTFYKIPRYIFQFAFMWVMGSLVYYKNVHVGYTRKTVHITFFFIAFFSALFFPPPYEKGTSTLILTLFSTFLSILSAGLFIKPIRNRIPVVQRMFLSLDRPEDRPHTLLWLVTQLIAAAIVMIPAIVIFEAHGFPELIAVPFIIAYFGDGLAEPVGIRFGKHKYETFALFTKKKYTRSLEGSACVFIVSFLSILLFKGSFSPIQLDAALLSVPLLVTLAEAKSPHTWDSPALIFVGSLTIFLIKIFL